MTSAFGRRKARRIHLEEEDNEEGAGAPRGSLEPMNTDSTGPSISSNLSRKAFKKSSLRQTFILDDVSQDTEDAGIDNSIRDSNGSQIANKPTVGRSNSTIKKKKPPSSRLSFGPDEIISGDAAERLEDDELFTQKKATLGRRVVESNALRKTIPYQGLPVRVGDDAEERPTYSKDYLKELKSSTPSTPVDMQSFNASVEDELVLDASELDGATIVEANDALGSTTTSTAIIPSEAEIREKKERRARLAHEKDFISLNDESGDHRQLSVLLGKKKAETRLVREDEDLGEGFDEFVDDGRISLGKKQEREARRRQRKEMADMIHQAEGSSDEESDDSEAERRAAYEAAQTRAGMDGLVKPSEDPRAASVQMPSRITPLPVLSECLERLQMTLGTMEQKLAQKQKKMADLEQEKKDISARETEVQELLKQAGARYSALREDSNVDVADPSSLVQGHNGPMDRMAIDRGLESFGNTPTTRADVEDVE